MSLLGRLPLGVGRNSGLGISLVLVAGSKALVVYNTLIIYKALTLFSQ